MPSAHMIMPMAGHGSRFAGLGYRMPKPLIELNGKAFFVRATEGIIEQLPGCALTFVILAEHQAEFGLGDAARQAFPGAEIVAIPEVTAGALDTALVGLAGIDPGVPVIINDCDHAFGYSLLPTAVAGLASGMAGFLSHFSADSPNFSYARYGADGALIETVEKRVVSNRAIAGIYGFADAAILAEAAAAYRADCPYDEPYVSGVYNTLVGAGKAIAGYDLDWHVPFGTPAEFLAARQRPEVQQ